MSTKLRIVAIAALLWVAFNGLPHVPLVHEPPLVDAPGLNVLIVRERDDDHSLPAKQLDVFESVIVRQFVKDHGGQIRVWDRNNTDIHDSDAAWRKAFQAVTATPWMIVSSPKGNYSGKLPADVEGTVAVIGKYAQ